MFQLTKTKLDTLFLGLLFFLSTYLCYEVSSVSFELLNLDFPFITKMSSFFSALLPLTIFLFYLFTTKYMFTVFDLEFKFLSIFKIISLGYIPIVISQAVTYFILINLDKSDFDSSYSYLNSYFFGFELKEIINLFEYFWVLFYLIFLIKLKIEYQLNIKEALIICLTPTLFIMVFNYIWRLTLE